MKSEAEVREMVNKFAQARDDDDEDTAVDCIQDALLWVLDDGSRDDYDLEQYLPDEEDDNT